MRGIPLAQTHPDLAAEAVGWDPATVSAGFNQLRAWRCGAGHEWNAVVANRARLGRGCPYCSGRFAIPGETDLATTDPALGAQAHGWDPTTLSRSSNARRLWRCGAGHEWEATVNSRSSGHGCPFCSGRRAVPGVNDLPTLYPALVCEADGWDPAGVAPFSSIKRAWRCKRDHRWLATVGSRSAGNGCPYCSNKLAWPGFNDLATTDPLLASQADGWDLATVLRGSPRKVSWRCALEHTWSASLSNRATKGQGCPYCSGRRALAGFNDLATTDPLVAATAAGWDPTTLMRSSNKHASWRCDLGHIWTSSVAGRTRGFGCPVCAAKQVLAGFNDLATTHPEIASQACGWDPTTITHGSDRKRRWRCAAEHEWVTSVANRVGGRGCPTCATYGFDPTAPAWLYLMAQSEIGLLQVGITNTPATRLAIHKSRGWTELDLEGPMDGTRAREREAQILNALRAGPATMALESGAEKFDGYTESWVARTRPVDKLSELEDAGTAYVDLTPCGP